MACDEAGRWECKCKVSRMIQSCGGLNKGSCRIRETESVHAATRSFNGVGGGRVGKAGAKGECGVNTNTKQNTDCVVDDLAECSVLYDCGPDLVECN
jgi:hypothetical protein